MKHFLFLISLILCVTAVSAQDKAVTLSQTKTFHSFAMGAADTITNNDQLYHFEVNANSHLKQTQDWLISLDSISGSPNVAVLLQGKKFEDESWTNIGTAVTWKGTSSDTTIIISNTTANRYRFYKLGLDATATAQKSRITKCEFKVWLE